VRRSRSPGHDNGLGAFSHTAGATFEHTLTAADLDAADAHISATTGVHGIAGSLVDSVTSQILANKTLTGVTATTSDPGVTVKTTTVAGSGTASKDALLVTRDSGAATVAKITNDGSTTVKTLTVTDTSATAITSPAGRIDQVLTNGIVVTSAYGGNPTAAPGSIVASGSVTATSFDGIGTQRLVGWGAIPVKEIGGSTAQAFVGQTGLFTVASAPSTRRLYRVDIQFSANSTDGTGSSTTAGAGVTTQTNYVFDMYIQAPDGTITGPLATLNNLISTGSTVSTDTHQLSVYVALHGQFSGGTNQLRVRLMCHVTNSTRFLTLRPSFFDAGVISTYPTFTQDIAVYDLGLASAYGI
jgi:hypothetical protein